MPSDPPAPITDAELAALVSELGGDIPLDEPASLIRAARSILAEPDLRNLWRIEDDVYDAVDALCTVVDTRWPSRPIAWHLERFVLWHGGVGQSHVQAVLKPTESEASRRRWGRLGLDEPREPRSWSEVYPSAAGRNAHADLVKAAAALTEHCVNERFALEGLEITGNAALDTPEMADITDHIGRHLADEAVQDWLCRFLGRLVRSDQRRTRRINDGCYSAERALHLIRRITAECEGSEDSARTLQRMGSATESFTYLPLDNGALERLYAHITLDDRLRVLAHMATALASPPAREAVAKHCKPERLVPPLLASPDHAEAVLELAEAVPALHAIARRHALEGLSQLAELSPDLARAIIRRDPSLLSAAFTSYSSVVRPHTLSAIWEAIEGAVELIEPIAHSSLPIVARFELLARIDRADALDLTMALLHASASHSSGQSTLDANLIQRLWWVAPAHWLELALCWPEYFAALARAPRFVTWIRFHTESRRRVATADLTESDLPDSLLRLLVPDYPPPLTPPAPEEPKVEWLMGHFACADDPSLRALQDFIDGLALEETTMWAVRSDAEPEGDSRLYTSLTRALRHAPESVRLRLAARRAQLATSPTKWERVVVDLAGRLSRDELATLDDETVAQTVLRAAFNALERNDQSMQRAPWPSLLAWALSDIGLDAGSLDSRVRWLVAILSRLQACEGYSSTLVIEGLLDLLCRVRPAERVGVLLEIQRYVKLEKLRRIVVDRPFSAYNHNHEAMDAWNEVVRAWPSWVATSIRTLDELGHHAERVERTLDTVCRGWCQTLEASDDRSAARVESPLNDLLPVDRRACLPGLLEHFASLLGDGRDHSAFVGDLLALVRKYPDPFLDQFFDIIATRWLSLGRFRWCAAADGRHWGDDREPRSTVGRTIDTIWSAIVSASADSEQATYDAETLAASWAGALRRAVLTVPLADPGLVEGVLHTIARLSAPGDRCLLECLDRLPVEGEGDDAHALEFTVHRGMAEAIIEGALPPRPLTRRVSEARRALIRSDHRVRGT